MRKIAFRAWDKKKKVMFNKILDINFCDAGIFTVVAEYNDEEHLLLGEDIILMQSTGLPDKNGKEIFEGDILDIYYSENDTADHYIGLVEWGEFPDRAGFTVTEKEKRWGHSLGLKFLCEVLGNIHEHPDLLGRE